MRYEFETIEEAREWAAHRSLVHDTDEQCQAAADALFATVERIRERDEARVETYVSGEDTVEVLDGFFCCHTAGTNDTLYSGSDASKAAASLEMDEQDFRNLLMSDEIED